MMRRLLPDAVLHRRCLEAGARHERTLQRLVRRRREGEPLAYLSLRDADLDQRRHINGAPLHVVRAITPFDLCIDLP